MLRSERLSAPAQEKARPGTFGRGPRALAALVLLAGACAGDGASPVEPVPTVTTNAYALATVDGQPLPWRDPVSGATTLADTLWLRSSGQFERTIVTNRGVGGTPGTWAYVSGGLSLNGGAPAAQRPDGALVFTLVVSNFGATQISVFRPVTP